MFSSALNKNKNKKQTKRFSYFSPKTKQKVLYKNVFFMYLIIFLEDFVRISGLSHIANRKRKKKVRKGTGCKKKFWGVEIGWGRGGDGGG